VVKKRASDEPDCRNWMQRLGLSDPDDEQGSSITSEARKKILKSWDHHPDDDDGTDDS
jgi:hypothetical protein